MLKLKNNSKILLQNIATSPNAACSEESESVLRIPNRAVHLEKRTAEEF